MPTHKEVITAFLQCKPEPGYIELAPKDFFDLIRDRDAWESDAYRPAMQADDKPMYSNVAVHIRDYLKGWRVVPHIDDSGFALSGCWDAMTQHDERLAARIAAGTITSDDFDETEALRFEAARDEARKRRLNAGFGSLRSYGERLR